MPGTNALEVTGGKRLEEIAAELKAADVQLRLRLTREIRRAAAPLVPRVRAAIARIPSKDDGKTGLKRDMAKATTLMLRSTGSQAGLTIRVDGRKMPGRRGTLPAYMEGRKKPWRHPVYGHSTWADQEPNPYFFKTVDPVVVEVRLAIDEIARSVLAEIR